MKELSRFKGMLSNSNKPNIMVSVDVIEYSEDKMFFSYSPALDLIGYGKSKQEARESWETVLEEYLTYAVNKKTLIKDLQSKGWQVKKNKRDFKPPTFSWMLQNNKDLADVYDKHNFQKTTQPISVPLAFA